MPTQTRILVDAADCPVKAEIYRLAARYGLPVVLVGERDIGAPFESWLTKVVAGEGQVSDTIAGEAGGRDLVITDDAGLAGQLCQRGVMALTARGQRWSENGPHPHLPEKGRGHNRARFEAMLEDELSVRVKDGG